jgi:hypothetical protein
MTIAIESAVLRVFEDDIDDGSHVLRLEGRIVGPWVDELRRSSAGHAGRPGELVLDLARVSFLDASGVALIRDLAGRGVRVVNSSPFVAEQLRTA